MRIAAATLVFALLASAAHAEAPADVRKGVDATLDALHAAAARGDGPAYFALYAPGAVFIGTDAAERWTMAQFHAYADAGFAQRKGWAYVPRERHVDLAPVACACVAVFDELLDSKSYGTSRGTGVLVKGADGAWKVSQYALTFPIPNDLADGFTDQIKAFEAKAKAP
jgi:ketosteroid isomerase-like protein